MRTDGARRPFRWTIPIGLLRPPLGALVGSLLAAGLAALAWLLLRREAPAAARRSAARAPVPPRAG